MGAWVLLSAVAVTARRTDLSFEQSLSDRYKIYSTLLIAIAYTSIADRVRSSRVSDAQKVLLWRSAFFVSFCFYRAGMVTGTIFLKRRHDLLVAARSQYFLDPAHNVPDVMPRAPGNLAQQLGEPWRVELSIAIAKGLIQLSPPAGGGNAPR